MTSRLDRLDFSLILVRMQQQDRMIQIAPEFQFNITYLYLHLTMFAAIYFCS